MKKYFSNNKDKLIIAITMFIFFALFATILPLGHDLHYHVYRIGAMAEELKLTNYSIPIRMFSTSFNNYGYGVPLFYGDMMLYFPALLVAIFGLREAYALQMLLIIIFFMAFGSSYWGLYRITKNKDYSLYFAFAFSMSPYFLIDLCIRMAVGEALSFIFLPLIATSIYGIVHRINHNDWLVLSISATCMLLSHNLSVAMVIVPVGLYTLISLILPKEHSAAKVRISILLDCFKAGVLALGLSASFIIPFVEASLAQKYQVPAFGDESWREYFVNHSMQSIDFIVPYELKKIINVIVGTNYDTDNWTPGGVGVVIVLIIFLIIKKHKSSNRVLNIGLISSIVIYLILYIKPAMRLISAFLSVLQFGWRLIFICTLFFSLYLAYQIQQFQNCKTRCALLATVALIGFYIIGLRYAYQVFVNIKGIDYIIAENEEFGEHYIMDYNPNDGDNFYLPAGIPFIHEERDQVVLANNDQADFTYCRTETNHLQLDIHATNCSEAITYELPLYYYKGYGLKQISGDVTDSIEITISENKLISLIVPSDFDGVFEIYYMGTNLQKLSNYISLLTIIITLGIIIKIRRSSRAPLS